MGSSKGRRSLTVAFTLVLAVVGLAGGVARASMPPASSTPASALPATAAEFFGSVGITVTPIDAPVPGAGMSFTDWQADNLYRQARAGEGWTGEQWRGHFPLPDGVVPVDFIVAAWVAFQPTPAATAARLLVDPSPLVDAANPMDPAVFVFPDAVMALFIHDLASGTFSTDVAGPGTTVPLAETAVATAAPSGWRNEPRQLADACEGLLSFYDTALQWIYDAVGGKDTALGVLAQQAIGLLPVPKPAFHVPEKSNMGTFSAMGLLVGLAGAINPWSVSISIAPNPVAYGVAPAAGNETTAKLVVDPGISVEWPAALKSCAALAGIDLPEINPVGAVVTWGPLIDGSGLGVHATVVDHTDVVMSDGTQYYAELGLLTAVETAEQATGLPIWADLPIQAGVQRPGDQTFQGVVELAIARYLGPDSIFGAILGALAEPLTKSLDEINSPKPGVGTARVTFHLPPDPTTTSPESTAPVPPEAAWRACAGRSFVSEGTADMPTGVVLTISADGTDIAFDFAGSQPVATSSGGMEVSVQLAGGIFGTGVPGSGNVITTSVAAVSLSGTVNVGGNEMVLDPTMLDAFTAGAAQENLICNPDGSVTVQRVGDSSATYIYR